MAQVSTRNPTKDSFSRNWKELLKEADRLYMESQYEEALIKYHRAKRIRPHSEDIRLGILRCEESLNKYLRTKATTSRKSGLSESDDPNEDPDRTMSFAEWASSLASSFKATHSAYPTEEMKSDARHMRKLARTKDYFSTLMTEMGHGHTSQQVRKLITTEMKYLQYHSSFWKHQIPPDAAEQLFPKRPAEPQGTMKKELTNLENSVINSVLNVLKAFQAKEYQKVLTLGKNCVKLVESSTYLEMDNKDEISSNLHSAIGSSYFELGQYEEALEWHQTDLEIGRKRNLPSSVSRALGNIGRVHAKVRKYEAAIKVWEEKLPMCRTDAEKAWLYHELGYCYMAQDDGDRALDCADQSYDAALKMEKTTWLQNSILLTAQALVMLGRLQDALFKFQKAMDIAEREDKRDEDAILTLESAMSSIKEILLQSEASQPLDRTQTPEASKPNSPMKKPSEADEISSNAEMQSLSQEPHQTSECTKTSPECEERADSAKSSQRSQEVTQFGSNTSVNTLSPNNVADAISAQSVAVAEAPSRVTESSNSIPTDEEDKTIASADDTKQQEDVISIESSDNLSQSEKPQMSKRKTMKKSATSNRSNTSTQSKSSKKHRGSDSDSVTKIYSQKPYKLTNGEATQVRVSSGTSKQSLPGRKSGSVGSK